MAQLHARSRGLKQSGRRTVATPRVDWRFLIQETKEQVAETSHGLLVTVVMLLHARLSFQCLVLCPSARLGRKR
eukprot:6469039-Lingulodinium_polyedra.AAC.1